MMMMMNEENRLSKSTPSHDDGIEVVKPKVDNNNSINHNDDSSEDEEVEYTSGENNEERIENNGLKTTQTAEEESKEEECCSSPSSKKELTIESALGKCGNGKFQAFLYLPLAVSSGADAAEVMMLTFLTVVLKDLWNLSDAESASIMSSVFAGLVVGTLITAPFADLVGRRSAFLLTHLGVTVFGFLTAVAQDYTSLLVIRILLGVAMGGTFVSLDTIGEFFPPESRGQGMVSSGYFGTTGELYISLMAYLILGECGSDRAWRIFVTVAAIPCFLVLILGYFTVPESPRWLLAKGKHDQALDVLRKIARENGKDPDIIFPPRTILVTGEKKEKRNILEIINPTWRTTTILLWINWFCLNFVFYGLLSLTTNVFSNTDTTTQASSSNSQCYTFQYVPIIISAAFEYVGVTIVVFTVESRFGRIRQMTFCWFTGGIFVFLFGIFINYDFVYGLQLTVASLGRMSFIAGSALIWAFTPELYPTSYRVTAHGACAEVGRMGGFASPYLVDNSNLSMLTIGGVLFGLSMLSSAAAWSLPETKGKAMGLALDDGDGREVFLAKEEEPDAAKEGNDIA